jgi:myo-inositol-1-phosphate synthase
MPSAIAQSVEIQDLFIKNKTVLLGDDIKSQVGSTTLHRMLLTLLQEKGGKILSTYQLNIGGNTDFKNMRDPIRSAGKKKTKEAALASVLKEPIQMGVGPSDYVPHLKDHKIGYISIEASFLLGMHFSLEAKIKLEDSPNSAAVVINAIRCAKLAQDKGHYGVIHEVCASFFKHPVRPFSEQQADLELKKYFN